MYLPKSFEETRRERIFELVDRAPFGLLVTAAGGAPFATHVPMILDRTRGPNGTLRGHLAKASPHARQLGEGEALCVFQGPHAYVSARHYVSRADVPTWNYVAVHAYGTPRPFEDRAALRALLDELSAHLEGGADAPWSPAEVPARELEALLGGIVGFEVPIERLEGKWKLGQNRDAADVRAAIAGLSAEGGEAAAVAALMDEALRARS